MLAAGWVCYLVPYIHRSAHTSHQNNTKIKPRKHMRDWNYGGSVWHKAVKIPSVDILKNNGITKEWSWLWIEILAARITLSELFKFGMNSFEQDPNKFINTLMKSFAEKFIWFCGRVDPVLLAKPIKVCHPEWSIALSNGARFAIWSKSFRFWLLHGRNCTEYSP